MNRDHVKPLFAAGIEPNRDSGIGKICAIRHQQQQAIGSGTRRIVSYPGAGDDGQDKQATERDDGSAVLHSSVTTCPDSRAHKVPNTTTPSSTSMSGAL